MKIMIDRFGQINIAEDRFGGNDYGRDQKGWDNNNNGRDDHGRGQAEHGGRKF